MKGSKVNRRTMVAQFICILFVLVLMLRMMQINSYESEFLVEKGIVQYGKLKKIPTKRGKIYDRNGELLAISAEAYSIFVKPSIFKQNPSNWKQLENYLGQSNGYIEKRINNTKSNSFTYLQPRLLAPQTTQQIMDLELKGLGKELRYQRFYPQRDAFAHLIGYTNDDHVGQEGIELIFDDYLSGKAGNKKIFLDAKGREIASPDLLVPMIQGKDLFLTVDHRVQFYSNEVLIESIKHHNADSGSIMIIDSGTGEIIAMVNAPTFNPNSRATLKAYRVRNRAITDSHEPGSTLKPFVIAAALENRVLNPSSKINTSPGLLTIGNWKIGDGKDHGVITVEQVLEKSSNVGAAKISDMLTDDGVLSTLGQFGFGEYTGAMLPGESLGNFPDPERMSFVKKRSLSFGYGISVTTAQLARAYSVFANNGFLQDLKISKHLISRAPTQIVSKKTSNQVLTMLRKAVLQGTGKLAQVANFDVAGKTGTVRKVNAEGYSEDEHTVFFAGILPTKSTNYVCVVVIDNPRANGSTGGGVAAPVFSKLMEELIRTFALRPSYENIVSQGEI